VLENRVAGGGALGHGSFAAGPVTDRKVPLDPLPMPWAKASANIAIANRCSSPHVLIESRTC
jgi:hypothetical protein